MPLAVFFLLLGMFASELALFGIIPAAWVGAVLFAISAVLLGRLWTHFGPRGDELAHGHRVHARSR